jgi:hypothetical protein
LTLQRYCQILFPIVANRESGDNSEIRGPQRLWVQVVPALHPQGNGAMSQNEPDDSAFQVIDRYITETSTSQPRPDAQPLSVSQRLQALGEKKVGTFTPLLDFQNAQSAQEPVTPLLPNVF